MIVFIEMLIRPQLAFAMAVIDTCLCASNVQHLCNICKLSIWMNSMIYLFHLTSLCRFTLEKLQLVSPMISFRMSWIALRGESHLDGKFFL